MKNQDQEHIIQLLQQQDKVAISWLYDKYSPALYGIVLKIVRSEEIAQDVVQESFVKAWRNGPTYDSKKGTLFTWLLNITRNLAIDKTRSASFRNNQKIQTLDQTVFNNRRLSAEQQTDHIGLNDLVHQLEDKYKEVINLAFLQGYTHQETAEKLELPLGTVKSRIRIALRELRKGFHQQQITILLLLQLCLY
jgi:RNA polymerase sigma factor (sigma-70 family)